MQKNGGFSVRIWNNGNITTNFDKGLLERIAILSRVGKETHRIAVDMPNSNDVADD